MRGDLSELTGWAPFNTFGLREDWVALYLREPAQWQDRGGLGSRQVESLARWLRIGGLVDSAGRETPLCRLFRNTWPAEALAWQLLWVNVVFAFPTATWYALVAGTGQWTTVQLSSMLCQAVPRLAPRTAHNGILELVGLLERTPVGRALRQGDVQSSRPRSVRRDGLKNPSRTALLYAAQQILLRERKRDLPLCEDVLWPWVVFGCSLYDVVPQLVASEAHWLRLDGATMRAEIPLEALRDVALF